MYSVVQYNMFLELKEMLYYIRQYNIYDTDT